MVTKAELEAEVKTLRAKLRERDAKIAAEAPPQPARAAVADMPGMTAEDVEAAIAGIAGEVEQLHRTHPMLTLLAAFGTGILLSRILR